MDDLCFLGTREEILQQLHKFMNETEANKFFVRYIDDSLCQRLSARLGYINAIRGRRTRGVSRFHDRYSVRCKRSVVVAKRMLVGSQSIHRNARNIDGGYLDTIDDSISAGRAYILNKSKVGTMVYKKVFSKIVFILCAISLDITLMLTIGLSPVGVALSASSIAFNTKQNVEKEVAQCIIEIVKKRGNLPKFSSIKNRACKNYKLNCVFMSKEKCNITKDMFKRVVVKLIEKKVLILESNAQ